MHCFVFLAKEKKKNLLAYLSLGEKTGRNACALYFLLDVDSQIESQLVVKKLNDGEAFWSGEKGFRG